MQCQYLMAQDVTVLPLPLPPADLVNVGPSARLGTRPGGPCWWCGAVADSREHKFKRTDLKRLLGDRTHLIWAGDGRPARINGPGADLMKFGYLMCKKCNNKTSQVIDRSYDRFTEFAWNDVDKIHREQTIDLADVYGPLWKLGAVNLARFHMKQFACRLTEVGVSIPVEIIDFLNGCMFMPNVWMYLYEDVAMDNLYRSRMQAAHEDVRSGFNGALCAGTDREGITYVACEQLIGTFGIQYGWDMYGGVADPFYNYRYPTIYRRHELSLLTELRRGWPPFLVDSQPVGFSIARVDCQFYD